MRYMKKKNTTIDDLAVMVQKGFNGVDERFDGVDDKFEGMNKRFDIIEDKLESIEKLILVDHKRRIERLETEVRELKDLFAMK